VALDWTLDLLFSKDLVKFISLRAQTISKMEEDSMVAPGEPLAASLIDQAVSELVS
jgi:hypothetical protein